jgi:hypothetical protein
MIVVFAHLPDFIRTASDCSQAFDWFPSAENIEDATDRLQVWRASNPSWRPEVQNCCGSISRGGTATIWLTVGVTGFAKEGFGDVKRESVLVLTWRRMSGKQWRCIRWRGIRGPGLYIG